VDARDEALAIFFGLDVPDTVFDLLAQQLQGSGLLARARVRARAGAGGRTGAGAGAAGGGRGVSLRSLSIMCLLVVSESRGASTSTSTSTSTSISTSSRSITHRDCSLGSARPCSALVVSSNRGLKTLHYSTRQYNTITECFCCGEVKF
jgi:hypothetical protein